MKSFFWLLFKAAIFFLLFAFAMGNRDEVALHFMPGHVVTMPMMAVVLGSFALGVFLGILVMVPRWWRLRRGRQGPCLRRPVVDPSVWLVVPRVRPRQENCD